MSRSFIASYPVRFGEIDQAGVMYYPALFDRIHRAFEDFWAEISGKSYQYILEEVGIGFPLVELASNFSRPFRFGETLRAEFVVLQIGKKSLRFRVQLFGEGEERPRAEAELKTAVIDMKAFSACSLPEELRKQLEPYRLLEDRA
jgi:4-hydroxybenzoyl-CoA thioesterase